MANELDELTGPVNGAGRDINVIEKQLPTRVGWGSTFFEIVLWCLGIIPGLIKIRETTAEIIQAAFSFFFKAFFSLL